jgi:hypothetical protein
VAPSFFSAQVSWRHKGGKNMAKPTRRLHLRLAADNPIFNVPAGDRTRRAEEWLRLGSQIERLEKTIDRLEKIGSLPKQEQRIDNDAKKAVLAAFENW